MNKITLISNIAPKYREAIYRLIDNTFNCEWYFGYNNTNIENMDLTQLSHVHIVKNRMLLGHWYWQKGVIKQLFRNDTFLITGELFCLSTWLFLFLCRLFHKKRVYLWTHGWYGKETKIKCILKKIYFRQADGIFLYGNYAKQLMLNEGFEGKKLFVIHNSLDYSHQLQLRNAMVETDVFRKHFNNMDKTLIFIGRLTEVKRIDLMFDAVAELKKKGKIYNIVLVGDGVAKERLEGQAKQQGINVWFYGACYDDRLNAELIYNADLCVSPGNVGLTAIHAMTFGCPVLTHNRFDLQMPEFEAIKEGETGAFFAYNDESSLADAIEQWFASHAADRDKVREACYKEIDLSWNPQFQMKVIKSVFDK